MNSYSRLAQAVVGCIFLVLCGCTHSSDRRMIEVRLKDELGAPVPNAMVSINLPQAGVKKIPQIFIQSNEYGVARAEVGGSINVAIGVTKRGYYNSRYLHENLSYDVDIDILLKRVVNPIPMIASFEHILTPDISTFSGGVDLEIGDWVEPFGRGKIIDFIVSIEGYFNSWSDRKSELVIEFPNEADGFVKLPADRNSEFKGPYFAPLTGYKNKLVLSSLSVRGERIDSRDFANVIVFRTRSKVKEDGVITAANYTKFYGGFWFFGPDISGKHNELSFSYYFNPKINDRNLEFDRSRNLHQNIEFENRVFLP